MTYDFMARCDKEMDTSKAMVFEVKNKTTKEAGYLNIDPTDYGDLESNALFVTIAFAFPTYGEHLKNCPIGAVYTQQAEYVIKRLK